MSTTPHRHHHKGRTHEAGTGQTTAGKSTPNASNGSGEERFRMIQLRAHELWEQGGRPDDHGSRERFWLEAEKAITASCSPNG